MLKLQLEAQREERECEAQQRWEECEWQRQLEERAAQLKREEGESERRRGARARRQLQREEPATKLKWEKEEREHEARLKWEEREAQIQLQKEETKRLEIEASKKIELRRIERVTVRLSSQQDDHHGKERDLPVFVPQEAESFFGHFERIKAHDIRPNKQKNLIAVNYNPDKELELSTITEIWGYKVHCYGPLGDRLNKCIVKHVFDISEEDIKKQLLTDEIKSME
ncbi:ensconsin-like [Procambarus clarkii]|uniref:ensconsin-like n=1 Tax=Procambarus clarkii TaxID=6728 RepID=UPI0037430B7F